MITHLTQRFSEANPQFLALFSPLSASEVVMLILRAIPLKSLVACISSDQGLQDAFLDITPIQANVVRFDIRPLEAETSYSVTIDLDTCPHSLAQALLEATGFYVVLDAGYVRGAERES